VSVLPHVPRRISKQKIFHKKGVNLHRAFSCILNEKIPRLQEPRNATDFYLLVSYIVHFLVTDLANAQADPRAHEYMAPEYTSSVSNIKRITAKNSWQ
jgi:hypothetical protein